MQIVPTGGEAVVLDVTPFESCADSGVIQLAKDTEYTVKQKNKEQGVILLIIKESD